MIRPLTTAALAAGLALLSAGALAATCDIGVDQGNFKTFTVNVDGHPFKDKRYLTYDDAARLRDVLVKSGACAMPRAVTDCKPAGNRHGLDLRLASAGNHPGAGAGTKARERDTVRDAAGFQSCRYQ